MDHTLGTRALLLTDDTGLRIKARGRRLEVVAPPAALRSEEEPDDIERELERAKREIAEARTAVPDLRLSFEAGGGHLRLQWRPVAEFAPSVLSRLLREWRDRHPRVSGQGDVRLPDGTVFSTSMLAGMPGYRSPEAAAERNAEIERVFSQYEAFLRNWPATLNAVARAVEFRLVLENDGTGPAEDVDVRLTTAAPGHWARERPELPAPPELARERGPFDFLHSDLLRSRMPEMYIPDVRRFDEPIDGPNISDCDEPAEVHWTVKRAKHLVPVVLPAVYFQFNATEDVKSFTVNVRLIAANMRKPRTDALHVAIETGEPLEPPSLPSADADAQERE